MHETRALSLGWEDPPEEKNGNPLQYPCLENPMDRGDWQAMVHRVTESWTQLKWFCKQHARTASPGSYEKSLEVSSASLFGPPWPPALVRAGLGFVVAPSAHPSAYPHQTRPSRSKMPPLDQFHLWALMTWGIEEGKTNQWVQWHQETVFPGSRG